MSKVNNGSLSIKLKKVTGTLTFRGNIHSRTKLNVAITTCIYIIRKRDPK